VNTEYLPATKTKRYKNVTLLFSFLPSAAALWLAQGPDLTGEGGRGPGPQASHQQGASHQTLHIFFVRDMCVRDYRLLQYPIPT